MGRDKCPRLGVETTRVLVETTDVAHTFGDLPPTRPSPTGRVEVRDLHPTESETPQTPHLTPTGTGWSEDPQNPYHPPLGSEPTRTRRKVRPPRVHRCSDLRSGGKSVKTTGEHIYTTSEPGRGRVQEATVSKRPLGSSAVQDGSWTDGPNVERRERGSNNLQRKTVEQEESAMRTTRGQGVQTGQR